MRNYVQPGNTLTLPAPSVVTSGSGVQIGSIFGVANGDALPGGALDLDTVGVFTLPKASAVALAIGDPVYWDAAANNVTATATGNQRIGVAVIVAPNPSGTVDVRLNGSF